MYGAIIGDLVGSIYEYDQTQNVHSIKINKLIEEESFYSDDTILTIAILDAILHDKNYDYYLRKYVQDFKGYHPKRKPYFDTPFSPNLMKWSTSDTMGESHGNGAMMRISPVGFMFDKEEDVIEHARLATMPSHNSKEAIDSATTIALIIFYLRKGLSLEEIYQKLNLTIQYKPFKRFNYTCEDTIENCLYVLYHSHSFEDAMRKTMLMGGDTDTNCAIVGSMAEALYGVDDALIRQANEKIPSNFVKLLKKAKQSSI